MSRIRLSLIIPVLALAPAAGAVETGRVSVAALKEDFAALYAGLAVAHYDLYAHRSQDEYDRLFEQMLAELDAPLTEHEARVRFQRFAAFGNVAHALVHYDQGLYDEYRENGGTLFPVSLRIVDGRAYVHRHYSDEARVEAGSEILSINGKPMAEWLARTAAYVSADTPYIAHSLLEFQFPMYLWEDAGPIETFCLEILGVDGARRTVRVPALTAGEIDRQREAADGGFSLDPTAREATLLDAGVAYLRPGPFYNVENPESPWDNTDFVRFIDDAFGVFIDAGADSLIIDLRQNPGGDNSFSDPMIAWFATEPFRFASSFSVRSSPQAQASNQARIDARPGPASGASAFFAERYAEVPYGETFEYPIPEVPPRGATRFDGQVYVLIDRHSYSNAVTAAATIQDYGFGVIVGEKTSDMATTYGAMETFRLPNTGIVVGFPKARIVRPSGELRSDGVTPDVAITAPIIPAPTDVVLEQALDCILARADFGQSAISCQ